MHARYRERNVPAVFPIKMGTTYYSSFSFDSTYGASYWNGLYHHLAQRTGDQLNPGPPYLTGGGFDTWTVETDQYQVKGNHTLPFSGGVYVGGFLPQYEPLKQLSYSNLDSLVSSGYGDVSAYGPVAWNRYRPAAAKCGLGISTVELREVPRMLRTTAKGFHDSWNAMAGKASGFSPKELADHWLNVNFGWMPFVSDLRAFYNTCKHLDNYLAQLRRDNGRWIRRRGMVDIDSNSTVVKNCENTPGLNPVLSTYAYNAPYGEQKTIIKNSKKIWFSGAFRYYIPGSPGSWQWKARALANLFGAQPSPSLVWNLTPWTWLIDWCSNAGDVFANVSAQMFDNLCAKYAYVMGTTELSAVANCSANFKATGPIMYTWSAKAVRKTRHTASPFGFNLTGVDLTARQTSILAALGVKYI